MHLKMQWVDERQWVTDGRSWTVGGAVANMDMMASWVTKEFAVGVSTSGLKTLDYDPRDIHGEPSFIIPK